MPILIIAAIFVTMTSLKVFGADSRAITELGGSLYRAGRLIQFWYIFIVLRDLSIFLFNCIKGRRDSIGHCLAVHYFFACLDIIILGIFTVMAQV